MTDLTEVRKCIGLLTSMICGGEEHSETSIGMIDNARNALDRIEAVVAEQWISVKDRMPADCIDVLVFWAGHISIACWNLGDYEGGWYPEYKGVTYWMPLPEAPKEKENEMGND